MRYPAKVTDRARDRRVDNQCRLAEIRDVHRQLHSRSQPWNWHRPKRCQFLATEVSRDFIPPCPVQISPAQAAALGPAIVAMQTSRAMRNPSHQLNRQTGANHVPDPGSWAWFVTGWIKRVIGNTRLGKPMVPTIMTRRTVSRHDGRAKLGFGLVAFGANCSNSHHEAVAVLFEKQVRSSPADDRLTGPALSDIAHGVERCGAC